jgi:AcrR family transcriptional regulator
MTSALRTDRRRLMLAAAEGLAERFDPGSVGIDELAAAMNVSRQDFEDEFSTLENYFSTVQLSFFEGRLASVIGQAGAMAPGVERIRCAWTGYLDYSVAHAAVHIWCRRARQRFPALLEELRRRNHGVLLMIQIEFATLGRPHPMERARLAVGMVLETVRVEGEARVRNEPMRALLWSVLEMLART